MPSDPRAIGAVAALDEPVRRSLYDWVAAASQPVSRDAAAAAVGVSRALAAFHLDRLVRDGLLEPEYRRLTGRTGPGAGRPAKLYRRANREVRVSLPERRYDVAAGLFAEALDATTGGDGPPEPLRAAAHAAGVAAGSAARQAAGPRPTRARRRESLMDALSDRGYEPRQVESGEIRLGNCPFDALVDDHRDLVCGMNLALADGIVDGLRDPSFEPRLDPLPGMCCIAIAARRQR